MERKSIYRNKYSTWMRHNYFGKICHQVGLDSLSLTIHPYHPLSHHPSLSSSLSPSIPIILSLTIHPYHPLSHHPSLSAIVLGKSSKPVVFKLFGARTPFYDRIYLVNSHISKNKIYQKIFNESHIQYLQWVKTFSEQHVLALFSTNC